MDNKRWPHTGVGDAARARFLAESIAYGPEQENEKEEARHLKPND